MKRLIFLTMSVILSLTALNHLANQIELPIIKSDYKKLTTYDEMTDYLKSVAKASGHLYLREIGKSSEGRSIYSVEISKTKFGEDKNKIKVLFFAQQHGNEQSGKEGALILINEIASGNYADLLDNIDLAVIPQINPDGSEKDKRRNGNGADLNRNHLLLSEPETAALHSYFMEFLPEVTLDVHEYSPYGKEWEESGYRKNFDEQLGTLTNPNIDASIIDFQKNKALPYVKDYIEGEGFSFNEYILGGPPGKYRMRHSTADINDGRQSFGILGTLSFILEGKNGRQSTDSLKHRAFGQYHTMAALLHLVSENNNEIKKLTSSARTKIINLEPSAVSIVHEHIKGENPLMLTLLSLNTGKDTVVKVEDYHPSAKSILSVNRPQSYLIPKNETLIISLLKRHGVKIESYTPSDTRDVYQYRFTNLADSVYEETKFKFPSVEKSSVDPGDAALYYSVPLNQLHGNMLVIALEPQSILGICQYEEFSYLLKENVYPILREESR